MRTIAIGGPAQSAERTAYEYLRTEILSGRLPGGTPIRQEAIGLLLGMSRIPVRDAIAHLAASGLVSYEQNRRVVVTVLNEADLVELFEMRAVLEGLAARHSVTNLTKADFDQLSWLASRMDQTESSEEQWIPIHHEFHELLCRRAGLPRLMGEIQRLRQSVEPYVRVLINLNGAAELRTNRHNHLVSAILQDCSPENAERLVREHIEQASRAIAASIRSSQKERAEEGEADPRKAKRVMSRVLPEPVQQGP